MDWAVHLALDMCRTHVSVHDDDSGRKKLEHSICVGLGWDGLGWVRPTVISPLWKTT